MNRRPRLGRIDFTSLQVRSEFMAIFNVNRAESDFAQGWPKNSVFMLEILAVTSHFIRKVCRTKFYTTYTDLSCNPSFITGTMQPRSNDQSAKRISTHPCVQPANDLRCGIT
jgi:hypothetical protein